MSQIDIYIYFPLLIWFWWGILSIYVFMIITYLFYIYISWRAHLKVLKKNFYNTFNVIKLTIYNLKNSLKSIKYILNIK